MDPQTRKVRELLRDSDQEKRTAVLVILDESSSMERCIDATLSGFNEYVQMLQAKKDFITLTLTTFNTVDVTTRFVDEPVEDIKLLTKQQYRPNAMTPLYDAIMQTVNETEKKLQGHPISVLCVIITDGEENSSKLYTRDQVSERIAELTKLGWTFTYLGANQDAWQVGRSLGIQAGNTMSYAATNTGTQIMYASLARSTSVYLAKGSTPTADFFHQDDNDADQKK